MKVLMFGWEFPPHISGGLGTACHGLTHSLRKEDVEVLFVVPKLFGDEPTNKVHLISASEVNILSKINPILNATPCLTRSAAPKKKEIKANEDNNQETPSLATDSEAHLSDKSTTSNHVSNNHLSKSITYYTETSAKNTLPATTSIPVLVKQEKGFTYVEVPSGLTAYRALEFNEDSPGLEHWNYSFKEVQDNRAIDTLEALSDTPEASSQIYPASTKLEAITNKQSVLVDNAEPSTEEVDQLTEPEETGVKYAFSGSYGPNLLKEVEQYAEVAEQIAKDFSFDVIHAHDWMTFAAGLAAKKISGKPLVVHIHATEYDRAGNHGDSRVLALEQQGMENADLVVTVSEWTKNIAITKFGIAKEKIEVVHNGIILKGKKKTLFSSPFKEYPVVTFLGRITHQKGPLFFVEAARKVIERIPEARFVVAGAGDLLPSMISRVAQLRMSSHFHFTGFLKGKEIDKVWSISNVYVMPSVSEPFGIAPLEAIQAGVPVIISKQSGVAEVMPHAIVVDFWNSNALADAICSVLKYKSLSKTLKKNGSSEIKNITWDKAAKKINQLYYELVTHA